MKAIALLIPILLTACATSVEDRKRTVNIESDPPGARIFVGRGAREEDAIRTRNFIGVAPIRWVEVATPDGKFEVEGVPFLSDFVPPAVVFFADPPSGRTNLYPQRQVFHAGSTFVKGDRVPEGIFFDLTRPAPSEPEKPAKK